MRVDEAISALMAAMVEHGCTSMKFTMKDRIPSFKIRMTGGTGGMDVRDFYAKELPELESGSAR